MQFETKRALLTYLGKNPDDNKLVDRMILRWEVFREDWMYHLITNKKSLIEENRELKLRVKELEKSGKECQLWELMSDLSLWTELEEAKIQWKYYQDLYEAEKEDKQERIRKCFRRIKNIKPKADWEEFRDWVMSDDE